MGEMNATAGNNCHGRSINGLIFICWNCQWEETCPINIGPADRETKRFHVKKSVLNGKLSDPHLDA